MRKSIILLLSMLISILLTSTSYWARECKNIYSEINWVKYFSSIHCTEDITFTWIVWKTPILKKMSDRYLNEFIVTNNYKIELFIDDWWVCDEVNTISEIKSYEDVIYSNNGKTYSSMISSIESAEESIDTLIDDLNSKDLYNTTFESTKSKFSKSSMNYIRIATSDAYYDKLDEIRESIYDKQREKLTTLYILTESQKFIDSFYNRVNSICENYSEKKLNSDEDNEEEELSDNEEEDDEEELSKDEQEEILLTKYKKEFNDKFWEKLDSLSAQALQQLSVKLIWYAYTSKVFKRLSPSLQEKFKLKIKALKSVVDERL